MLLELPHERRPGKDRFIQSRSSSIELQAMYKYDSALISEDTPDSYEKYITQSIFSMDHNHHNPGNLTSLLSSKNMHQDIVGLFHHKRGYVQKESHRIFKTAPEKILDAPDLKDDYYLNLLDWSSNGLLSIGLADRVYLYAPEKITELCQKQTEYICSLSFSPDGNTLAVGLSNGKTQLHDVQRGTVLRTLKGHSGRVSSSAFTYGTLFTGSRDSTIVGHDPRASNQITLRLQGHHGEVCGLKHDPCGLASGSNDNTAIIWDLSMSKPRFHLEGHKAAVKALAWCPWQRNLLATGGGSSDKTMRFWNIQTGKNINIVNTESQVCSLIWNKNDKEILSSHGYSENQLCVWKYPECIKLAEMHGHTQRVLHMSLSPDNSTVCTASADETLRFWQVFDNSNTFGNEEQIIGKLNPKYCTLR